MQHLLLLHGAIGSSTQLQPLRAALADEFHVHLFDFPGHGGKPATEFSIAAFASAVTEYLKQQQIKSVHIFGYSMGGYVAMYLAKQQPQSVQRIATLATKFHWDEMIAAREVKMLQPDVIAEKLPAFADALQQRHAPYDWKNVLQHTAGMLLQMGKQNPLQLQDYASIAHPCLIMLGDKDKMVSREETLAVAEQLPHATFRVLPETPHPIEQVNIPNLASLLQDFFNS